jgi:3-dehydroquinate dehydratase-2
MKKFLVINGPNLNLLGTREPEVYGDLSLSEIMEETAQKLKNFDISIDWFQSNSEGEIISRIGESLGEDLDALIINPAAYSHYSIGILDALQMVSCKVVEVHLTNTHKREDYRRPKLTAQAADIIMEGPGKDVYYLAIYSQLI